MPHLEVTPEELTSLHAKLSEFMLTLPDDEASTLSYILARAATGSRPDDQSLLAESLRGSRDELTLPQLANAIEPQERFASDSDWVYNIWSYQF
jgi:hypothetical protein